MATSYGMHMHREPCGRYQRGGLSLDTALDGSCSVWPHHDAFTRHDDTHELELAVDIHGNFIEKLQHTKLQDLPRYVVRPSSQQVIRQRARTRVHAGRHGSN
jgi:hypothetical protein